MKFYIIAGEASGDLHGSNLVKAIKSISNSNVDIRGWGGDLMASAGAHIVRHYRTLAFMGFVEVIKNLKTIFRNFKECKKDIQEWNPDVLILIDYPGFNLRIAKWAKENGIRVVYYITPQVWAWHKSRVHTLGKFTDLLLVILPFEKTFFNQYGYEATYVGHPLLDAISTFVPDSAFVQEYINQKTIALLPGSRKQEISAMLPVMLKAVDDMEDTTVLIAGAPSADPELYQKIMSEAGIKTKTKLVFGHTYDILSLVRMAIVSSGTATLETALFNVPQVVCYKGSSVSYFIAKKLVNIGFISLVNLIAGKKVVHELIQSEFTVQNIRKELARLESARSEIINDYQELRHRLDEQGASARAATHIISLVKTGK